MRPSRCLERQEQDEDIYELLSWDLPGRAKKTERARHVRELSTMRERPNRGRGNAASV